MSQLPSQLWNGTLSEAFINAAEMPTSWNGYAVIRAFEYEFTHTLNNNAHESQEKRVYFVHEEGTNKLKSVHVFRADDKFSLTMSPSHEVRRRKPYVSYKSRQRMNRDGFKLLDPLRWPQFDFVVPAQDQPYLPLVEFCKMVADGGTRSCLKRVCTNVDGDFYAFMKASRSAENSYSVR